MQIPDKVKKFQLWVAEHQHSGPLYLKPDGLDESHLVTPTFLEELEEAAEDHARTILPTGNFKARPRREQV